jgi:uncharacterized protein
VDKLSRTALALALGVGLAACRGQRDALISAGSDLRPVIVEDVHLDLTGTPVLALLEKGGELRRLAIWIDEDQAQSIHVALSQIELPRPNTHDLVVGILGSLGRKLQRVAITALRDGTYYAVIDVAGEGGTFQLDARPSDAIALAIRTGAPIFVDDGVLSRGSPGGDTADRLDADWRAPPAAPALPPRAADHSRGSRGV